MATIPRPHPKQLEVIQSKERYKVLAWGRRCFAAGSYVLLSNNLSKPIEMVQVGDRVVSYNTETGASEAKEVLRTYRYGVEDDPKPMVELCIEGQRLTSTYDHEYYIDGHWIPAIELAWGTLATSERDKFTLLCEQYGTPIDDELQRRLQDAAHQASTRRFWVFEDRFVRKNHQGTQSSGPDLAEESTEQATSESHRPRPLEQPSGQSGVGDTPRERGPRGQAQQTEPKPRREVRDSQAQRTASPGDTSVSSSAPRDDEGSDGKSVTSDLPELEARFLTRRFEGQDLEISSAVITPCQVSYDLLVEDNNNYTVENLLVHNSGKSVFAGMYTLIKALETQGNYYIVAPTERQAKSIYWNDILQLVIPKELIAKINNVEKTITFHHIEGPITLFDGTVIHVNHDETKPPSTISLRGVDNPEALRGVKLAGVVLDEYAFMDNAKYVFDTILQPALLDMRGWAVFISSPNGVHNPFYDLVKLAQKGETDYFYSHATGLDNPTVSKEEFEKIRQQRIDEGKLESFEQEYMAEFKSSARLVYKNFNSDRHYTDGGHMFDPKELPELGTDVIGIDFGWVDPFAAVFIRIDYEGNWWVYDEVYKSELTPSKALPILRAKMGDRQFSRIIGDAQGKTEIANFRELRFYITPSSKGSGSIKGGIAEVASLLEHREILENGKLVQRPRMRFSTAVTYTIKDMESYSHMLDAYGEATETPEDKNNHAPDAIRYIVTDYVKAREPRKRQRRQYDPHTGRMLS